MNRVMAEMPAIPLFRRKSPSVAAYVLGAIGAALLGSIAAMMIFSPRTRYRALGAARNTYGKMTDRLGHTRIGEKLGIHPQTGRSDEQVVAS